MITATDTRKMARESLSGKWGKAALIAFCYSLVEYAFSLLLNLTGNITILNIIFSIGILLISVPLSYGLVVSFMKLKRNEQVQVFDFVTIGFSSFSRAWKVSLSTLKKLILPFILLTVIPTIILLSGITILAFEGYYNAASKTYSTKSYMDLQTKYEEASLDLSIAQNDYYENPTSKNRMAVEKAQEKVDDIKTDISLYNSKAKIDTNSEDSFTTVGLILAILGFVLIFICSIVFYTKQLHYILSYNIAYDEPEMPSKDVVLKSKTLMKGNRGNYFVLTLSFVGWAILSVFTLGIGIFWLTPYIMVSTICFYEILANKQETKPELEPQDNILEN